MRFALAAASLASAALFCGCASTVPPSNGFACPALAGGAPPLISPAAGATGVPTTQGVITLGQIPVGGTLTGHATLTGNDGSTVTSGTLVFAPDGKSESATIVTLHAHTTYAVSVGGDVIGTHCDFPFGGSAGSFTTQ